MFKPLMLAMAMVFMTQRSNFLQNMRVHILGYFLCITDRYCSFVSSLKIKNGRVFPAYRTMFYLDQDEGYALGWVVAS